MPLPLPQLDDRAWLDLVEEGRALIPAWAPDWTNHNPSDPGITLVELFAWLTEMLIYRLNRVSDQNMIAFLRLLNGPDWHAPEAGKTEEIVRARASTLLAFGRIQRAVTARDFEELALSVNGTVDAADEHGARDEQGARIGRVSCVQGHNLPAEWEGGMEEDASADVSVVVLPEAGGEPAPELLHKVRHVLDGARLLATRVHVLGPRYVTLSIRAALAIHRHVHPEHVREAAVRAVNRFFDPLQGGPGGHGWPFGRDVYLSELYQLLAGIDGVDQVSELVITPVDKKRLLKNRLHEVEAVDLQPGELVRAEMVPADISIKESGK